MGQILLSGIYLHFFFQFLINFSASQMRKYLTADFLIKYLTIQVLIFLSDLFSFMLNIFT